MAENNELEKTLWAAADKLRSNMDAAEYKHVVLGLIFLKYISDAFYDLHNKLAAGEGEFAGADPEDADEYLAYNIFFVPEKARWHYLQDRAKQPDIGTLIDAAMDDIERRNASLKGVLPKLYADPELNKQRLGELIDLIGTIGFNQAGHQARICWDGSMNISWASLPTPRARRAVSSTRRRALSSCWWPCWNPTPGGSMTAVAAAVACLCRVSVLSRSTRAILRISRSLARSRTRRRCVWPA